MLHTDNPNVNKNLLNGHFGLEKEGLRVTEDGFLAHTPHPFPDDPHIVRDFCENQTEINTPVTNSPEEAVQALAAYSNKIRQKLETLAAREYLWPFSNPPYIRNEDDIPVARFEGGRASKTEYRNYLSDRYGRYKMTFSGIHVNYSFDDALLRAEFAESGEADFTEFKNQFYVELAEKCAAYAWLLTALTAASPLLDRSFMEKGRFGGSYFDGLASIRCSELGYWNFFAPLFDYTDIRAYTDSISHYVDEGILRFPTELYYPIRLKPTGLNRLEVLREKGVDHIELRMFDLNPTEPGGVEVRDVVFTQLFLVWLASLPRLPLVRKDQVQAVQNFKNAAHYDLKTVKIMLPSGDVDSVTGASLRLIGFMQEFYKDFPETIREVLEFEEAKFIDGDNRYAWQIRSAFDGEFVQNGLVLAKKLQEAAHV